MISIVTVCLNPGPCIKNTLDSVLSQKNCDFEYIIKDGGSTEEEKNFLSYLVEQSDLQEKIQYISKKDTGIYDAMNQAIEYCHGEWILYLNAGDILYSSDSLARVFCQKDIEKNDVIYGNAIARDTDKDGIWYADIGLISKKMPFCHQTCFIKTELLKKFKFDESYKIAGDYDMIIRLFQSNLKFYNSNKIVSVYYLNGVSSVQYCNRLIELRLVRERYGYHMGICEYFLRFMEAWIKEKIDAVFPERIKNVCRLFYMKYVKKYGKVENGRSC